MQNISARCGSKREHDHETTEQYGTVPAVGIYCGPVKNTGGWRHSVQDGAVDDTDWMNFELLKQLTT
ncbi:MAG: hypothetical protein CME31_06855 [Gimesia sp.]|jgi:hypothetical protein|uniref:Uncharacterized protein n=1 Tax=Gimesia maris TaxID=122 RepID=A0A3D3R3D8_9PLAN|nr:hypothetical protein [Gimesia maris]MAC52247.1 hypothetical protein [Gimesia sp.]HCO22517.1 hypothetical protein [Gimesia maris]|tara:strand:+ start:59171 stop:59371 length:201 start_codon:yes stop_codon:yes gene_type:complete